MKRVKQHRSLAGLIAVPALLLMSLLAWATVIAPYGEPDSPYHLSSMYCSQGFEEGLCEPGRSEGYRLVRANAAAEICYRNDPDIGAACIDEALAGEEMIETGNGNFRGAYPDVYYTIQHVTVGDDAEITFRDARFLNATLVTLGLGLLTGLIRPERRRALWFAVAGSIVPLGLFTIASINPSAWVIYGPLVIFVATASIFEAQGWRRWALIGLSVIALVVVAGTRTDAGAFGLFAALAAVLVAGHFTKRMLLAIGLPALLALGVVGALMARTGRFSAFANVDLISDFFGTLAGRSGEGKRATSSFKTPSTCHIFGWARLAHGISAGSMFPCPISFPPSQLLLLVHCSFWSAQVRLARGHCARGRACPTVLRPASRAV